MIRRDYAPPNGVRGPKSVWGVRPRGQIEGKKKRGKSADHFTFSSSHYFLRSRRDQSALELGVVLGVVLNYVPRGRRFSRWHRVVTE